MYSKVANEDFLDKKEVCQSGEVRVAEDNCNTSVCGSCASAGGCNTSSSGSCSNAEGCGSKAIGDCSHAEGSNTRAYENNSHTEGCSTRSYGNCSHAEGSNTTVYSDSSHTEGGYTTARGTYSHAEGYSTQSNAPYSHAEGYSTIVNGYYSHAEGIYTTANGSYSHAEGYSTLADGYGSHAEGYSTYSRAPFSHAEGYNTDTKSNTGAHIMGIYGDADTPYSWFLAGGTSSARALAAKILYTGDAYIRNAWHAGGTGYSEMYNSISGQAIEPGYFVTLEGDVVRIANEFDKFILGVTSANPGFVTNSGELSLGSSYSTNAFNQTLYEDVSIPEKTDKDGSIIEPALVLKQPMLKTQSSITTQPATFSSCVANTSVTILGQVLVIDDGTCMANGYCRPNKDGIATSAPCGYRVMKRISDNIILIFFRC